MFVLCFAIFPCSKAISLVCILYYAVSFLIYERISSNIICSCNIPFNSIHLRLILKCSFTPYKHEEAFSVCSRYKNITNQLVQSHNRAEAIRCAQKCVHQVKMLKLCKRLSDLYTYSVANAVNTLCAKENSNTFNLAIKKISIFFFFYFF